MPEKIRYRERLRTPWFLRFGFSVLTALLFWGALVYFTAPDSRTIPRAWPSLVFITAVTALAYGILAMFHCISIRITRRLMVDGTRQPILIVKGLFKGDRVSIACRDIFDTRITDYALPWWRALLGGFGRARSADAYMITLPGWHGTGLAVRYSYESVFAANRRTATAVFPTRQAEKLQVILKTLCSQRSNPQPDGSLEKTI